MGLYFFPRGGSAQVARYLCRALRGSRWEPMFFSGSVGTAAATSNAERFFRGIRCAALDYTPARSRWLHGDDAMMASVPMSASYEDKGMSQTASSSISTMPRSIDRLTAGPDS